MRLSQLYNKFDSSRIVPATEQAFTETAIEYADFNRQQLKQGKNKEGQPFAPYRDDDYADMKHAKNPLPGYGNPDYILTGDFENFIFSKLDGNIITTTSTDDKTAKIEARETNPELIFGVSDDNKPKYIEQYYKPKLKEILGL